MQSKGILRALAILIALACIWQLSFTFVARHYDNEAEMIGRAAAEKVFEKDFLNNPDAGKIYCAEENKAHVIDSLNASVATGVLAYEIVRQRIKK